MKVQAWPVWSVLAAGIVGLASCASLPLPDTPDQSLLIIPQILAPQTANNANVTVSMALVISEVETGKDSEVPVAFGKAYTALSLKPGSYLLKGLTVHRAWRNNNGSLSNQWTENRDIPGGFVAFYIKGKVVRLYEKTLEFYEQYEGGFSAGFVEGGMVVDKLLAILPDMEKDSHWPAWEGYQLVNFPTQ